MKITIKDKFGESKTYSHEALKVWRDGEMVEIYYNRSIDNGRDYRKVILWCGHQPACVEPEEERVSREKPPRETDPFTKEALENRHDTPEEKALLEGYRAIEGKKKRVRRTKAQIEADNAAKQENKGEENV